MAQTAALPAQDAAIQIDGGPDAAAPAEPIDAAPADASGLHFVDVGAYLMAPLEMDAWYRLLAELGRDFDEICADTLCEEDFTSYQSLRFRCSVERSSGVLGGCSWVLAASKEEVVAGTGAIEVSGKLFHCAMPVRPATSVEAFVEALTEADVEAIRAPLPGTDRSLFDGLADCL